MIFIAAIRHLTPEQRAVFVMREVLGWPAADSPEVLGLTVASVNSALQRAKPALKRQLPADRSQWRTTGPTAAEQQVVDAYLAASAN